MDYKRLFLAVVLAACDGGGELGGSEAGKDGGPAPVDSALMASDTFPAADTAAPAVDLQASSGGASGAGGAGGFGGSVAPMGGAGGSGSPVADAGGGALDVGGVAGMGGMQAGGAGGAPAEPVPWCASEAGTSAGYCGHTGEYGEFDGELGYRRVARYKDGMTCGLCRRPNQSLMTGCLMPEIESAIGVDGPILCVPDCGECCYREPANCTTDADCCAPLRCLESGAGKRCG